MSKPTHMDLFSGIGGFALAAQWAGFETTSFCETDTFCRAVLKKHWPGVLKYLDIKDISHPDHVDLLTGGFPCQPFSVAGKKKGVKDDRYLWPEMLRIIRLAKPTWVVAENVTGIVAMELDNIIADLAGENYATRQFIIPACAANAPHRRDRVWIVANLNSKRRDVRLDCYTRGYLPQNENRNMAALHKEWGELKPDAWETFSATDWFHLNTLVRRNPDGISARMDKARIKALGNAIVPQVAYPILKSILQIEETK